MLGLFFKVGEEGHEGGGKGYYTYSTPQERDAISYPQVKSAHDSFYRIRPLLQTE